MEKIKSIALKAAPIMIAGGAMIESLGHFFQGTGEFPTALVMAFGSVVWAAINKSIVEPKQLGPGQ